MSVRQTVEPKAEIFSYIFMSRISAPPTQYVQAHQKKSILYSGDGIRIEFREILE